MNVLLKIKLKKGTNTLSLDGGGLTYHPTGNKFYTYEKSKNIYKYIEAKEVESVKIIKLSKK